MNMRRRRRKTADGSRAGKEAGLKQGTSRGVKSEGHLDASENLRPERQGESRKKKKRKEKEKEKERKLREYSTSAT